MDLNIITSGIFGSVQCDIWQNADGDIFMTNKQLGGAIGYADPQKGMDNLIDRNPQLRSAEFSVTLKLRVTDGKRYETRVFTEDGIYECTMLAKTDMANQFRGWVRGMLKTIRKTGGFVANDDLFVDTYLPHADEQSRLMFRTTLETVRAQNSMIAVMQPKADYFDALVDRNLLTSFRTTAQELHVYEGKFIDWLLDMEYIYRDQKKELKAYAEYVPSLFDYKEWGKQVKAGVQTMITPKGRETFRLLVPPEIKKK